MAPPADLYCSRADVAGRLPPGAIGSDAGICARAKATSNALTFDGHGFETDAPVLVRAVEGQTLSSPLVEGTTYFVIRDTNATFRLAASAGGVAIDLTTDCDEVFVSREPDFDTWIEFYSRWADTFLPAHLVPLGKDGAAIHPLVRGLVADLVAKRMLNASLKTSEAVDQAELAAKAQLERLAKGLALRGAPATAVANGAIVLSSQGDTRGWGTRTLP